MWISDPEKDWRRLIERETTSTDAWHPPAFWQHTDVFYELLTDVYDEQIKVALKALIDLPDGPLGEVPRSVEEAVEFAGNDLPTAALHIGAAAATLLCIEFPKSQGIRKGTRSLKQVIGGKGTLERPLVSGWPTRISEGAVLCAVKLVGAKVRQGIDKEGRAGSVDNRECRRFYLGSIKKLWEANQQ